MLQEFTSTLFILCETKIVFQTSLSVLKIYNLHSVHCIFSALVVKFWNTAKVKLFILLTKETDLRNKNIETLNVIKFILRKNFLIFL